MTTARALIDLIKRSPGKYGLRLDRCRLALAPRHGGDRAQKRRAARARALSIVSASDDGAHSQRCANGLFAGDFRRAAIWLGRYQGFRGHDSRAVGFASRIPTLKEAGIDVEADAWGGLIAPAQIREAMTARIGRLVGEAIGSDGVRAKLAAQFMAPIPGTPAAFRARIDADIAGWSPVIAAAKIKLNE